MHQLQCNPWGCVCALSPLSCELGRRHLDASLPGTGQPEAALASLNLQQAARGPPQLLLGNDDGQHLQAAAQPIFSMCRSTNTSHPRAAPAKKDLSTALLRDPSSPHAGCRQQYKACSCRPARAHPVLVAGLADALAIRILWQAQVAVAKGGDLNRWQSGRRRLWCTGELLPGNKSAAAHAPVCPESA